MTKLPHLPRSDSARRRSEETVQGQKVTERSSAISPKGSDRTIVGDVARDVYATGLGMVDSVFGGANALANLVAEPVAYAFGSNFRFKTHNVASGLVTRDPELLRKARVAQTSTEVGLAVASLGTLAAVAAPTVVRSASVLTSKAGQTIRRGARVLRSSKTPPGSPPLLSGAARDHAISRYSERAGRSAGFSTDESVLAQLGYRRADNAPPGVARFENSHGAKVEFPIHEGSMATPFAPGQREALAQALRDGRTYTHPDVARVAAASRQKWINQYATEHAGRSAGYSTDESMLAKLGYRRADSAPPGVVRFENSHGAKVEFPIHEGSMATPFAPGQREALAQALRDGRTYTHPDVARVAVASRQKWINQYATEQAGRSAGYSTDESMLANLGYRRAYSAPPGVVRFENPSNGAKVEFPIHEGSMATPFAPGQREALAQALRDGRTYTHPDVARMLLPT